MIEERKTGFAAMVTTGITFFISLGLFTAVSYALGIQELFDLGDQWHMLIFVYAILVLISSAAIGCFIGVITYFSNEV